MPSLFTLLQALVWFTCTLLSRPFADLKNLRAKNPRGMTNGKSMQGQKIKVKLSTVLSDLSAPCACGAGLWRNIEASLSLYVSSTYRNLRTYYILIFYNFYCCIRRRPLGLGPELEVMEERDSAQPVGCAK